MPLSEHEQRILDEIERRLAADDPKFARDVNSVTPRGKAVRRMRRAVAGLVAGMLILLVGTLLFQQVLVAGMAAFAIMLPSAVVIGRTSKQIGREKSAVPAKQPSWFDRMEERWKKRFDKDEE